MALSFFLCKILRFRATEHTGQQVHRVSCLDRDGLDSEVVQGA